MLLAVNKNYKIKSRLLFLMPLCSLLNRDLIAIKFAYVSLIYYIRIMLGWISSGLDVGIWTGLGWPRIGTGGGRL